MKSSKKKAKLARKIRRQVQARLNSISGINLSEEGVNSIIDEFLNKSYAKQV